MTLCEGSTGKFLPNGPANMAQSAERLKDFKIKNLLGKGAFGDVYKVVRVSDGATYALKKINISSMSSREVSDTLNEIRFLASIRHPNIIGFMEAFLNEKSLEICVVMEFADGGDLAGKVEKLKAAKRSMDENLIWAYGLQLVDGVQALHAKRIIHRDIKTANCFLTADGHLKVGDLNVSKLMKAGMVKTQIGTPYYMSPEIWKNKPYDYKSDMWSIGCVLYELAAQHPPFRGTDIEDLSRKVQAGFYPKIPSHYSAELSDLIKVLLSQDPRRRPSIDELLAMDVVQRRRASLSHVMDSTLKAAIAAEDDVDFLATIAVPKNIKRLTHQLPAPCYPDLRPKSPSAWPVADPRRAVATARGPEGGSSPPSTVSAAAAAAVGGGGGGGGGGGASAPPTERGGGKPPSVVAGGVKLPPASGAAAKPSPYGGSPPGLPPAGPGVAAGAMARAVAGLGIAAPAQPAYGVGKPPARAYSDPVPSSRPSVAPYGGPSSAAPVSGPGMARAGSGAALMPPKYGGYKPSPLPTVMEGGGGGGGGGGGKKDSNRPAPYVAPHKASAVPGSVAPSARPSGYGKGYDAASRGSGAGSNPYSARPPVSSRSTQPHWWG